MKKIWQLNITPLFSENGESWSIGRVSFWLFFGYFTYFLFWTNPVSIPGALVQLLSASLLYNLGKKAVVAYKDTKTSSMIDTRPSQPTVQVNNSPKKKPEEYTEEDK